MKRMNNLFAVVFATIAAIAFYGAVFNGATWHYFTTILCAFLALLFVAANDSPRKQIIKK